MLGGRPRRETPFSKWPIWGHEEEEAAIRVVRSGSWWRYGGLDVSGFEEEFAAYHGAKHGIATTSGTVALRLALWTAGLKAGDEVILPPYTFLATATSVIEQNAKPVFVDVSPDTYNLDPELIEAAITPRTRAIVPVHFAGRAADLDPILQIAERHGLTVIEDSAHGHGGAWNGRGLGSIGAMGCFSFQASKNITAGEGGIVLTNDEALADQCRALHTYGRRVGGTNYEQDQMASNYRMTAFQGAILRCQLARLAEQTELREANAARLTARLSQIPGIAPQRRGDEETRKAFHLFLFRLDEQVWGVRRKRFVEALGAEGIPVTAGYQTPLHRQAFFTLPEFGPYTAAFDQDPTLDYRQVNCPVAEHACASEGCWMHHAVLLGTEADVDAIADSFEKVWENRLALA